MAHVEKYKAAALGNMCAHYERRAELERGYRRDNIDLDRTPLNYNLGPERDGSQVDFINERISRLALKRRPRKDAVRMCDVVVTLPVGVDGDRSREFFVSVYEFLEERYGAENVISAWVHLDEPRARPHMHFAFVPVTGDGRLSAKDVVGRSDLKSLHGDMELCVSARMGASAGLVLSDELRGRKQLSHLSHSEYESATAELERLRVELEETSAERDALKEEVEEMRGALESAREALRSVSRWLKARMGVVEGMARFIRENGLSKRYAEWAKRSGFDAEQVRADEVRGQVQAARKKIAQHL